MFSSFTRNILKSNNCKVISPLYTQQQRNICKTLFIKGIKFLYIIKFFVFIFLKELKDNITLIFNNY
jgi:hypothetical protein